MIANSLFSRQSKAKGFTPHLFRGWGSLNSQPNRKGAGFTLLELLIVITILAILAVIIFTSKTIIPSALNISCICQIFFGVRGEGFNGSAACYG